jgi:hypothetical protein
MALDSCFYILGEVSIHDRCRVLGQKCNALGDSAARRGRRMDYRYRELAALDHNLCTGARTRASTSAKLLAASASEMWITWSAMTRLLPAFLLVRFSL